MQKSQESWAGSDSLPKADPDQRFLLNFQEAWSSPHIQNENMISFGSGFYWELFKYLSFIKPRAVAEITDECMAFLAHWSAWKCLSSSPFFTGIVALAIYLEVNKTHSASWHFLAGFFYFLRHITAGSQIESMGIFFAKEISNQKKLFNSSMFVNPTKLCFTKSSNLIRLEW